jgi:hypothetical protein
MKWAFIDYENVGKLTRVNLASYAKIIVFVGAKQHSIDFGNEHHTTPLELTYIKVSQVSKNNLDIHMAYYLADFNHQANKDVVFEVISNDKDLSPLISRINSNGRNCRRVGWTPEPKKQANATSNLQKLVNNITGMPAKKRPKRLTALGNHIQTVLAICENVEEEVETYLQALVKAKIINIDKQLIIYT